MYHWETADNKKYWTTDLSKKLINYFSKECITKPLLLISANEGSLIKKCTIVSQPQMEDELLLFRAVPSDQSS